MSQPPPLPLTWGRTWRRRYHLFQLTDLKLMLERTTARLMAENLPPDAAELELNPELYQVELTLRITPLPPQSLGRPGEVNHEVAR